MGKQQLAADGDFGRKYALTASLRAKRSNPSGRGKKEWIASAFAQERRRTSRRVASLRKRFAFVEGNDGSG
jgi:hypothetical protein